MKSWNNVQTILKIQETILQLFLTIINIEHNSHTSLQEIISKKNNEKISNLLQNFCNNGKNNFYTSNTDTHNILANNI